MRIGIAFALSAPSGAGKSTLSSMLLSACPNLRYSISCTTRLPRSGEINGKDYYFISKDEFEKMTERGEFAEWAKVHGNFYGTPLKPVKKALESGLDILFDVDTQGASQIKSSLPATRFVFILPPSLKELSKRLRTRALDSAENIKKRLIAAPGEIAEARWYDAIIINDNLERAFEELRACYLAATLSPAHNQEKINELLLEAGKAWQS